VRRPTWSNRVGFPCPKREYKIRGGKGDIYSGLLYLGYEGCKAPVQATVSGGFRLPQHTSGGAAGKYWLLGFECATSPAEVGRIQSAGAGQVMVEWPEAEDAWSTDDRIVFWMKKTSRTPRRLTFCSSYSLILHRKV